jgi:hypothetical protein
MSYIQFRLDPTVVDNASLSPDLDDNIEDVEDPPDLPKDVRIALAHQAWIDAKGSLTKGKAARIFGVSPSTLKDRIASAIPKALASQVMQRLTVAKEQAMRN